MFIDICDGYRGYIQIGKDGYIIQPLDNYANKFRENEGMFTNTAPHILEKLKTDQFQLHQDYEIEHNNKRVKRNDWNGYYLGDIWSTRYSNSEYPNRPGQTPPSEVIHVFF